MTEILRVRDMSASPGLVSKTAFGRLGFHIEIKRLEAFVPVSVTERLERGARVILLIKLSDKN